MDKKLDTKRLGVLTAAGLGVATLCAGVAFAFAGGGEERPERDAVPVGQLVDVPVSSAPTTSVSPNTTASPVEQQDAQVPAPKPPVVNNEPVAPTTNPEPTPAPPTNSAGEVTAPAPPPTVRCRMDDSDPVNYPNGREICETITPAP